MRYLKTYEQISNDFQLIKEFVSRDFSPQPNDFTNKEVWESYLPQTVKSNDESTQKIMEMSGDTLGVDMTYFIFDVSEFLFDDGELLAMEIDPINYKLFIHVSSYSKTYYAGGLPSDKDRLRVSKIQLTVDHKGENERILGSMWVNTDVFFDELKALREDHGRAETLHGRY